MGRFPVRESQSVDSNERAFVNNLSSNVLATTTSETTYSLIAINTLEGWGE